MPSLSFSVVSDGMAQQVENAFHRPLLIRIISALILAPLVLTSVWAGTGYFTAVIVVFAVILATEWQQLCSEGQFQWIGIAMVMVVVSPIIATLLGFLVAAAVSLLAGILFIEIITRIIERYPNWWLGIGCLYIGLACSSLIWIHSTEPLGTALIIWLLGIVWATDSAAYAAGRIFKGPKLAPSVSPNKTWSGVIGGLLGTLIVGVITLNMFDNGHPIGLLAVSILISIASQIGDLLESAIKRHFGVKDTGRIIPGHGGALDRVDGLLIAAPVAVGFILLQQVGYWEWT